MAGDLFLVLGWGSPIGIGLFLTLLGTMIFLFIIFRWNRGFLMVDIGLFSTMPSFKAHLNNADRPV